MDIFKSLELMVFISIVGNSNPHYPKHETASLPGSGIQTQLNQIESGGRRNNEPKTTARDRKFSHLGKSAPRIRTTKKTHSLEQETYCLIWVPALNVTADPKLKSLRVDYCLPGDLGIPSTRTCVTGGEHLFCAVVEKPACSHQFENLSSCNLTVQIKAMCENCYEKRYFNQECRTKVFARFVATGPSPAETTSNMTDEFPSSESVQFLIILIVASCGGFFVAGIIVVIFIVRRKKGRQTLDTFFKTFNNVLAKPEELAPTSEVIIPIPRHLLSSENSLS